MSFLQGRIWTSEEEASGEKLCLICGSSSQHGDKCYIGETSYKVIGVSYGYSEDFTIGIPMPLFARLRCDSVSLYVVAKKGTTDSEMERATEIITDHANLTKMSLPQDNGSRVFYYLSSMRRHLLIITLSVVSFCLIYLSVLKRRMYILSVCRLHGASLSRLTGCMLCECLFFLVIAFFLSFFLTLPLKEIFRLSTTVSLWQNFLYNIPIFCLISLLTVISVLVPILRISSTSGLDVYRK